MYQFNHVQQSYGQFPSTQYSSRKYPSGQNFQQIPRSTTNYQGFRDTKVSPVSSKFVQHHCNIIRQKAEVISSYELTHLLNELASELANIRNQKEIFTNLSEIINTLTHVNRPTLTTIIRHKFFTLARMPFLRILRQWNEGSHLNENEAILFRNITKLSRPLLSEVTHPDDYPPWLSDPVLLDTIAVCFTDISRSGKFFDKQNERETKSFLRLLDTYDNFQNDLNYENNANQEKLVRLLDPIIHCLTSQFYLDSFNNIQTTTKSMSKKDKFFLVKCPTFLISYNGSRREETMNTLLSAMLPKYITILDKLVPIANQWYQGTIRAATQMFKIVNHGPTNGKIVSSHLPFIDHVLRIIDVPTFYNNLQNTLSNRKTSLINTAISLLVSMINEPTILAHVKQKKVTSSFLRLTSAQYEPLVYNVYNLLAYTTSEEDIKSMHNPGILLSTVVRSLQTTINKKSTNEDQVVQLFETLKGLVQHDQIKEEVLKQDILSFLVECTNKVTQTALPLLLETLWSSSFSQDVARVLRTNNELLEKVQTISKNTDNEPLKKAADGLVWKLVKEPAFLDKVAQRAEEETSNTEQRTVTTQQVIIGEDGQEKIVTTTKRSSIIPTERVFQYDIMISYCHADKDLIKKIHQFLLDHGFKIWIDLNNMFGPAMAAMADAVENSEFVLLCMSDSYKQSTYCQAEAEYAFNCKRRLVPLIVRPGYRADGWLGFMIGSRIYVDYGTFDFDTACGKLMDEMSRQRKRPLPSKTVQIAAAEKSAAAPKEKEPSEKSTKLPSIYMKRKAARYFNTKYIDRWTDSDVLDFLHTHGLHELMPLCEKMDGPSVIQLYKMCISRHSATYTILNDQIKATHKIMLPVGTYTRFLSIMERVLTPPAPSQIMLSPPQPQLMLMPPSPQLPPIPNSNSPYDIIVTSNAPASEVLQMVQRVGSQWHLQNRA